MANKYNKDNTSLCLLFLDNWTILGKIVSIINLISFKLNNSLLKYQRIFYKTLSIRLD